MEYNHNIDLLLDNVDLTFPNYEPSDDARKFWTLARLLKGEDFEIPNAILHYWLIDLVFDNITLDQYPYTPEVRQNIRLNPRKLALMLGRGVSKSTTMTLFLPLYLAVNGTMPGFGEVSFVLGIGNSQEDGAKVMANVLRDLVEESVFCKSYFESYRFTDEECEFVRKPAFTGQPKSKRSFMFKVKGAQALALDEKLYTDTGTITMGDAEVGQTIMSSSGSACKIVAKSEVFHKDMYLMTLADGRTLKVSSDHLHPTQTYKHTRPIISTTLELKSKVDKLRYTGDVRVARRDPEMIRREKMYIPNSRYMQYSEKVFPENLYKMGERIAFECQERVLGKSKSVEPLDFPKIFHFGSRKQRLHLLQEFLAPFGQNIRQKTKVNSELGHIAYSLGVKTTCEVHRDNIIELTRSLGGTSYYTKETRRPKVHRAKVDGDTWNVYVLLQMVDIFTCRRSNIAGRAHTSVGFTPNAVPIVSIELIEQEPSQCIEVSDPSHKFATTNYINTHNSGIRGIRYQGERIDIILADDLVKNESDASSDAIQNSIKNTIYSDSVNAMKGNKGKLILIGTPMNKADVVVEAIESTGYSPVVIPLCEKMHADLKEEDFMGVWPHMHSYERLLERFNDSVLDGSVRKFNQELMLRLSSEKDALIAEHHLNWYKRNLFEKHIEGYKIIISTDLTTTSKAKSDFSAIAAWAIGSSGDIFLLDLWVKKEDIESQYNEIFRMVTTWANPDRNVEVGIELDGGQVAHVFSLTKMMVEKNVYFSFAKQLGAPSDQKGILSRSVKGSKHDRFKLIATLFHRGKFHFPDELKYTSDMKQALRQLKYVTHAGFLDKDDFCDAVSQLGMMDYTKPQSTSKTNIVSYDTSVFDNPEVEVEEYNNPMLF